MELVKVDTTYHPAVILSLNRADKCNALNAALVKSLCEALEKIESDSHARVVIIKGEGNAFCAGLDLHEAQDFEKSGLTPHLVEKLFRAIYNCSCPTIALVQGAAIGGGVGVMAACDFVIAEENSKFSLPETRRGLMPALIMPLLVRRIGLTNLREMLFFEETIDTQKAVHFGLINRVVNREKLMAEALYYSEKVIEGAPGATRKTKELLEHFYSPTFTESSKLALEYHTQARVSEEAKEGINAFLEKRKPRWVES